MPRLNSGEMITGKVGTFGFSGVRPDKLGSTEYTLVTIVVDKTGSVSGFGKELLACLVSAVDACRKSPRVNNLLVRYVTFNENVDEEHGFTPVVNLDSSHYKEPRCQGGTALYDACFSAIGANNDYGRLLSDQDYQVNGIVFVITDGGDNMSKMTTADVAKELKLSVSGEFMESVISVLIGINTQYVSATLDAFSKAVGFTQYIDAGSVTKESLAKLASFVSRSISSQSTSLGSGGPSQPLTF